MTILEAAAAVRAKEISCAGLTRSALDRIAKLNPKYNAFLTVMAEAATARAMLADNELAKGVDRGPLHGIPVAVKDVFCTKGVRTTCGSKLFEDHVPEHDAAVVEKLEAAGAVIIGKTGLHELAYGVTSNNPHFGAVRNPWDTDRIPGGSSGGSGAAVAAGMAFMAMGSDTGGSIRIPAAYCGTVGLKPTFGRVSRYGVMPLDFSLDHMGPLTRSVRDAAVTLAALAGYDRRDDTSSRRPVDPYLPGEEPPIRDVRIGVPENYYFEKASPDAARAAWEMIEVARRLGASIVPVRVPDIEQINVIGRVILQAEASALMERHMGRRELFGADVLALLDQGRLLAATDYVNAQRLRRVKQREFEAIWEDADCLLTPTTPVGAPRIGQTTVEVNGETIDTRLASTQLVRAINVLGLPALSMPCGFDGAGMPLGLQIVGKPFGEPLILRVAAALEDSVDFRRRTPPGL